MIEANGTPRAAIVQRFVVPRIAGQYTICDALLTDQTPITGRFALPDTFDGEGLTALYPLGVSAQLHGNVTALCTGNGSRSTGGAFDMSRLTGRGSGYQVPALEPYDAPGGLGGSPSPYAPRPLADLAPPEPKEPPKTLVVDLAHMLPEDALALVQPLCEGLGGCSARVIPGRPSLAVLGPQEALDGVSEFIKSLDAPAPAYRLRATLFELDRSTGRTVGLDLALGTSVFLEAASASSGALSLGVDYNGASAAIIAGEDEGRVQVLSRPELRLMDGKEATFSASTEVPTVGQILFDDAGNRTQGIEYREAGLILGVTLKASGEGAQLQLSQELSAFSARASAVAGNPSKTKRSLRSTFTVPFGKPVLVGGLLRTTSDNAVSRVPFLGWPIGQTKTDAKTDVYLLLQVEREPGPVVAQADGQSPRSGNDRPTATTSPGA